MKRMVGLLLGAAFALAGCAKDDGLYDLSGNVIVDGQPAPKGEIILEPDSKSGNQGPATMTQFDEGKFSLTGEQGILGGKYNVTIMAFDGVASEGAIEGKPLLKQPYLENVDFPKEDSTRDFEIKTKR